MHLEKCESLPKICVRASKETACAYPARFGEDYLRDITEDALILSPSVRPDLAPLLAARARGVRLLSDAEIFFTDTRADCFAVSGSDGKSTTTALLSHLLSASLKKEVPAVGNIGRALTPLLSQNHAAYAVELSSFQLFHYAPKTRRAVITNLTENHLNWHKDMAEYAAAKARLYESTEEAALCLDETGSEALLKKAPFSVYSLTKSEKELAKCKCQFAYYIKNSAVFENGKKFFPLSLFSLRGEYNLYNLLAALATAAGFLSEEGAHSVKDFKALPHRCEPIGELSGIRFFDSSIDSSPSRTAKTLATFSDPVVLLLGGLGKGCSIEPLLPEVLRRCRAVIGFGPFGKEALRFLADAGYTGLLSEPLPYLEDAVAEAFRIAQRGDAVLLSPAATSYDEFDNFSERGKAFCRLVRKFGMQ